MQHCRVFKCLLGETVANEHQVLVGNSINQLMRLRSWQLTLISLCILSCWHAKNVSRGGRIKCFKLRTLGDGGVAVHGGDDDE